MRKNSKTAAKAKTSTSLIPFTKFVILAPANSELARALAAIHAGFTSPDVNTVHGLFNQLVPEGESFNVQAKTRKDMSLISESYFSDPDNAVHVGDDDDTGEKKPRKRRAVADEGDNAPDDEDEGKPSRKRRAAADDNDTDGDDNEGDDNEGDETPDFSEMKASELRTWICESGNFNHEKDSPDWSADWLASDIRAAYKAAVKAKDVKKQTALLRKNAERIFGVQTKWAEAEIDLETAEERVEKKDGDTNLGRGRRGDDTKIALLAARAVAAGYGKPAA